MAEVEKQELPEEEVAKTNDEQEAAPGVVALVGTAVVDNVAVVDEGVAGREERDAVGGQFPEALLQIDGGYRPGSKVIVLELLLVQTVGPEPCVVPVASFEYGESPIDWVKRSGDQCLPRARARTGSRKTSPTWSMSAT